MIIFYAKLADIGYVYNDMAALANEDSEQTVNYESSELDATQEYDQVLY